LEKSCASGLERQTRAPREEKSGFLAAPLRRNNAAPLQEHKYRTLRML